MGRSPCCLKEGLNKGAWTAMEDRRLVDYVMRNGEGKWRNLPKEAGLKRCGKSCRLRWLNYLRPDIKRGNISPDEEDLIIRLHRLLGNRWSLIAGRIPGRTDNEIKNYWNTNLSKKLGSKNKNNSKKQQQELKKNFTQSPSEENKEISLTRTDHKLNSSTSNYMMINKKSTGSKAVLEKKDNNSWTLDNNEGEFDMDFNLEELMNFTGFIGNDDENTNGGACSSSNAGDGHNNECNDFSSLFDADHWLLSDVDSAWSCLNGLNWDY